MSFVVRSVFATTMFTAAALVFLVQPMLAKQLLPTFGGSPGVWNAAVVFFQIALLVAYGIAHIVATRLRPARQVTTQLVLAALAVPFLPFAVRESLAENAPPSVRVGLLLVLAVGVPYLAVATASPLLQRWYASVGQSDSDEPWFLYVASNAGSLLGLLAFPFLIEPRFTTTGQERTWIIGFAVYAVGLVACSVLVRRRAIAAPEGATADADATIVERITRLRALKWIAIAAVPSALMLGVTTFITTDVASAPFIWVLPLALYLLSFIVTFGRRLRIGPRVASALLAVTTSALLLIELGEWDVGEFDRVAAHLLAMFAAAVLAHATLYADRPAAGGLTTFYLLMSVGGAIGGSFTALVAPMVFPDVYEYPLLLVAMLLIRPPLVRVSRERGPIVRAGITIIELLVAMILVLILAAAAAANYDYNIDWLHNVPLYMTGAMLAALALRRWGFVLVLTILFVLITTRSPGDVLHRERNFFGTLRVSQDPWERKLHHGTTLHGTQLLEADRVPTTYYTADGPIGDVFRVLQQDKPFVEVGAVGLGTGTLLGHARLWQRFSFFEIDPAVIDVARDPDYFTWISDSDVTVRVVEGDARLLLEEEDLTFDLLVLDAYSSDAVPVHLLTVEAMRTYLDRLADGAVMALHISSRHIDLEPVVAANAIELGLAARTRSDDASGEGQIAAGGSASQWIVLARNDEALAAFEDEPGWVALRKDADDEPWTDDFSNVAGAIRWLPWN